MKTIMNQTELRHYTPHSRDYKTIADPVQGFVMGSHVLELLGLQLQQLNHQEELYEKQFPYEEIKKLNQLKKYIDQHFLQEMTLPQLSRICLLNDYKVKKGFKTLFNTTVFGYIRKLRMDYAKQLLRHSNYTVVEIAEILNYQYPHHFSSAFKKFTGMSPSFYKTNRSVQL